MKESIAWIKTVDEEHAEGTLKSVYDRVKSARGRVANIFKVQSLDPRSLQAHLDLYLSLMFGEGNLSRKQREMVAVVVSAENKCGYCVAHHSAALSKYVMDEALIAQLVDSPRRVSLEAKEKAMVDYAVALTRSPGSLTARNVETLRRKGMNDEEILQLTLIAAYFNFVNRLASGLGTRLEKEGQAAYKY